MWIVVGVLFGLLLVALVVGFHAGPHVHAAAGILGLVAAGWLVLMALDGRAAPVLWALLGVDLAVSAGAGTVAWKALSAPPPPARRPGGAARPAAEGSEGVAVTNLTPEGVVRVAGEEWSARCANGTVRAGTRVQVLHASGVRLDVWGEDPEVVPLEWTARVEEDRKKQEGTA